MDQEPGPGAGTITGDTNFSFINNNFNYNINNKYTGCKGAGIRVESWTNLEL